MARDYVADQTIHQFLVWPISIVSFIMHVYMLIRKRRPLIGAPQVNNDNLHGVLLCNSYKHPRLPNTRHYLLSTAIDAHTVGDKSTMINYNTVIAASIRNISP